MRRPQRCPRRHADDGATEPEDPRELAGEFAKRERLRPDRVDQLILRE
jgi:hypothetical protein